MRLVRPRRALFITLVIVLAFVSVSLAGVDAVIGRFSTASSDLSGRLGAWEDAMHVVRDFPFFGTGLNTFSTSMIFYQQSNPAWHLGAAHNDYLQLAAEGGVLLGVPVVILVSLYVAEVRNRFMQESKCATVNWLRLGAATGLIAIALQETFEFSLQMPGNTALFVVLAAIAVHRPDHSPNRVRSDASVPTSSTL